MHTHNSRSPLHGSTSECLKQTTVRGLDTRCRYAIAHMAGDWNGVDAALNAAGDKGMRDFQLGRSRMPPLFADVTELAREWKRGYAIESENFAAVLARGDSTEALD
ncbi:hypothetical protein IMZ29_07235 [Achromobacter sp. GG226]|uniref:hypothetical protein n=1 Tax=Verticiella alkaliphila TaxID=2779529 RepID=UPI001C0D8B6A|nr:hypothetical protein [Verticiella sp. GG226]MBU4610341.1 hypothetical protein [Verticiella sp. GG226]